MMAGDEFYDDDVTSGIHPLDRFLVHEPIRLSGTAPDDVRREIEGDDEDWSCIDCGIPLVPGAPPICEECVEDGG